MPSRRIRSSQRKSRRVTPPVDAIAEAIRGRAPKHHRFLGISLGGGKTDKTCLSVLEYYPAGRKIFLARLYDKIKSEGEVSADAQIMKLIEAAPVESVAFDVPLGLPFGFAYPEKCGAYEESQEPELLWMWKHWRAQAKKKSPPRLFTPYTERCVEMYLKTELEEVFDLPHALGANLAPLTARAHYLLSRLAVPAVEVFPKLSLWRMGNSLGVAKSHLRFHRHWEGGQTSRKLVLDKMMDKNLAFIYDQDVKTLCESPQAFDSFLCALTGMLSFLGHCEARPRGFPRRESWIEFPKKVFPWP